ncbi:MAG: CmcI family methyltransferase [Hyphomicrobiales bacterium]
MYFTLVSAGGEIGPALAARLKSAGHEITLADETWISNARAHGFANLDAGCVICFSEGEDALPQELLENLQFERFVLVHRPGTEPSALFPESSSLVQVTSSLVIEFNPSGNDRLNSLVAFFLDGDGDFDGHAAIAPSALISAEELAKALCAVALEGTKPHYHIAGPDILSGADIASAFEAASGKKVSVTGPQEGMQKDASAYEAEFGEIPSHASDALEALVTKHKLLRTALSPHSRGETTICEEDGTLVYRDREIGDELSLLLSTPEAFDIASKAWIRAGWDVKHHYSFSWLGRPVIQLPEDMVRMQELISALGPDVIIETGIAHGGSLIFYASVMEALGHGRIIGIDIDIRPHNRTAIEAHRMFKRIELIEGSSTDNAIVSAVGESVKDDITVLVILDSNHTKAHVLAELNAYGPMVTPGSYIIATDGIMAQVAGGPRTKPDWQWNNPSQAALEFVKENPDFIIETPAFTFNESYVKNPITHYPLGAIKRIR